MIDGSVACNCPQQVSFIGTADVPALVNGHTVARQGDVDHAQVVGVWPEQGCQVGLLQVGPLVVHHDNIRRTLQAQRLDLEPGCRCRDHLGIVAQQADDAVSKQWMRRNDQDACLVQDAGSSRWESHQGACSWRDGTIVTAAPPFVIGYASDFTDSRMSDGQSPVWGIAENSPEGSEPPGGWRVGITKMATLRVTIQSASARGLKSPG